MADILDRQSGSNETMSKDAGSKTNTLNPPAQDGTLSQAMLHRKVSRRIARRAAEGAPDSPAGEQAPKNNNSSPALVGPNSSDSAMPNPKDETGAGADEVNADGPNLLDRIEHTLKQTMTDALMHASDETMHNVQKMMHRYMEYLKKTELPKEEKAQKISKINELSVQTKTARDKASITKIAHGIAAVRG